MTALKLRALQLAVMLSKPGACVAVQRACASPSSFMPWGFSGWTAGVATDALLLQQWRAFSKATRRSSNQQPKQPKQHSQQQPGVSQQGGHNPRKQQATTASKTAGATKGDTVYNTFQQSKPEALRAAAGAGAAAAQRGSGASSSSSASRSSKDSFESKFWALLGNPEKAHRRIKLFTALLLGAGLPLIGWYVIARSTLLSAVQLLQSSYPDLQSTGLRRIRHTLWTDHQVAQAVNLHIEEAVVALLQPGTPSVLLLEAINTLEVLATYDTGRDALVRCGLPAVLDAGMRDGWLAGSLLGRTRSLRDLVCPDEAFAKWRRRQQAEQAGGTSASGVAAAGGGGKSGATAAA